MSFPKIYIRTTFLIDIELHPVEVELEPQHSKKTPPGLVRADGYLTKNDKSYYFDVTGHVIANVDNMTNKIDQRYLTNWIMDSM
jgi:hypothetical protein